jgi:hypothetical protein
MELSAVWSGRNSPLLSLRTDLILVWKKVSTRCLKQRKVAHTSDSVARGKSQVYLLKSSTTQIKTVVVYRIYRGKAPYIKKQQLKRRIWNRRGITKM